MHKQKKLRKKLKRQELKVMQPIQYKIIYQKQKQTSSSPTTFFWYQLRIQRSKNMHKTRAHETSRASVTRKQSSYWNVNKVTFRDDTVAFPKWLAMMISTKQNKERIITAKHNLDTGNKHTQSQKGKNQHAKQKINK